MSGGGADDGGTNAGTNAGTDAGTDTDTDTGKDLDADTGAGTGTGAFIVDTLGGGSVRPQAMAMRASPSDERARAGITAERRVGHGRGPSEWRANAT
jgi:hypothetical protein